MTTLIIAFAALAETASTPMPDFAPGQMWSIKSASPTTAKVVIGRVDAWGQMAVHVSIIDVPIPTGAPGAGGVTAFGHVPFDKSALAASVDQLLATGVPPAQHFEGGYEVWLSAESGVFTVSVPEVIALWLGVVKRGRG